MQSFSKKMPHLKWPFEKIFQEETSLKFTKDFKYKLMTALKKYFLIVFLKKYNRSKFKKYTLQIRVWIPLEITSFEIL